MRSVLRNKKRVLALASVVAIGLALSGCTGPAEYIRNRFKVGPEYSPPPTPVAEQWIDAADARVRRDSADLSRWWTILKDPVLNSLIADAYSQNLSLREAGCRVLEARAELGIAAGLLFPQQQDAVGSYSRRAASLGSTSVPVFGSRYSSLWTGAFNLAWEIDFWGRFRRAVAAADKQLDASVENYDQVLVTLLGDVATYYVQARVLETQIGLFRANARLQREILRIVEARFDAGRVSELDVDQAKSTLAQTEAQIPSLEISRRQATNRLCVLLGMPPSQLDERLGTSVIPEPPPEVIVGIPAELLSRRPDVRRAERTAASQSEQIGIAQADFYPYISISGTLGYSASEFSQLFRSRAFTGSVGPSFQWNILNYGRIANNVRLQDAVFQELVLSYQNTVLLAAEEVENGIVTYLKAQERAKLLDESVLNQEKAVKVVVAQYKVGTADFTRVAQIEQDLVTQQNQAAQAHGQIVTGLIQVYRALGGGWEIRLEGEGEAEAGASETPAGPPGSQPPRRPAPEGILEEATPAPLPPRPQAPARDQAQGQAKPAAPANPR